MGSVTPLSVIMAGFTIFPNYKILGLRFLPFSLVAFGVLAFEAREFISEYTQASEERKELCREAHLLSILNGVLYGLYFKRYVFFRI